MPGVADGRASTGLAGVLGWSSSSPRRSPWLQQPEPPRLVLNARRARSGTAVGTATRSTSTRTPRPHRPCAREDRGPARPPARRHHHAERCLGGIRAGGGPGDDRDGEQRGPLGYLARRMAVETPFAVFALALPFVATGPRTELLGWPSRRRGSSPGNAARQDHPRDGRIARPSDDDIRPRPRSRPAPPSRPEGLVAIVAFMVRYVDVVGDQVRRMSMAQASRGSPPVGALLAGPRPGLGRTFRPVI